MVGILEKLGLKKKKEDIFGDLDKELGLDETGLDIGKEMPPPPKTPQPGMPPEFGQFKPEEPSIPPGQIPPAPMAAPPSGGREIEIIISKLDAVRAILTSMDQRLSNIEQGLYGRQQQQQQYRW